MTQETNLKEKFASYLFSPVSGPKSDLAMASKCEQNRAKVCGICTRKGVLRKISEAVLLMIKDHHYSSYNFQQMPTTICVSCDRILRFIDQADLPNKEDAKRKGNLEPQNPWVSDLMF